MTTREYTKEELAEARTNEFNKLKDQENKPMNIEIKGFKTFTGHDGYGFEFSLYINGKRASVVVDDGWGGGWQWHILPNMKELVAMFDEKCSKLPIVSCGKRDDGTSYEVAMDKDIWIDENLLKIADAKSNANGKCMIIDGGDIYVYGKYKKVWHDQIVASLANKYPNARLINGNPVEATIK